MRGKSKALKTRQDKDCTMLNHTSGAIQLELPLFATVGSVPQNSEMTSIGKSSICNLSTQK
jgi:putative transposase